MENRKELIKEYLREIAILEKAIITYNKNIQLYMEISKFSNMYNNKILVEYQKINRTQNLIDGFRLDISKLRIKK